MIFPKGMILNGEGKYQEALKYFKRTIDFDSNNPKNYKEIGKAL